MGDMQFIGNCQPGVPVDPGAGIPAAIRLVGIVDSHRHHIFAAKIQVRGDVVIKTDVAVRPLSEVSPVNPDFAVLVDAVEFNDYFFLPVSPGDFEMFPVPAGARGKVGGSHGTGPFAERTFDAPVVGQIQVSPFGIVEIRLFRPMFITLKKFPVKIEIFA